MPENNLSPTDQLAWELRQKLTAYEARASADAERIATLGTALQACVAYMKDDSGGYEVYRATLDSAEAALRVGTADRLSQLVEKEGKT